MKHKKNNWGISFLKTHSVYIPALALLAGIASMILLFFVFYSLSNSHLNAVVPQSKDDSLSAAAQSQIYTVVINNVPVPFLDPVSRREIGYIFLDIVFEVQGQKIHEHTMQRRDTLKSWFVREAARAGAGSAQSPGLPDYERLALLFSGGAERTLGRGVAQRIRVERSPNGTDL